MSTNIQIGSFAVFDLETTGLPELNFNKTKITELCIHGFAAADVLNAKDCNPPRINHKLSMVFNPMMRFDPTAEEITGLNNYMLEEETSFNSNAAIVVVNFLKHLRQPVCLVAHNGNRFDFPVLKQTLENLRVDLPSGLTCADSIEFLKYFDLEQAEEIPNSQEDSSVQEKNENQVPMTAATNIDEEQPLDRQRRLETTPKRKTSNQNHEANPRKQLAIDQGNTKPRGNVHSRRALFTSAKGTQPRKQMTPYSLGAVYQRIFGHAPDLAHLAEGDVVSLKKVIFHYGKSFVDYAEAHAKPFQDVKKLGAP